MSHFTVIVIGENHEQQLEKFNENIEVDSYVQYTKQELIEKERKEIEDYKNGTYAEYLKNKEEYLEDCKENKGHIKYITEEFPLKLNFNDEQLYQEAIKYYNEDELDEDGNVLSTYNPNSKWDWYGIGGRWSGFFKIKEEYKELYKDFNYVFSWSVSEEEKEVIKNKVLVDQALKKHIDFEGMEKEAEEEARELYEKVEKACGGEILKIKSWEEIEKDKTLTTKQVRQIYQNQENKVKFENIRKNLESDLKWVDLENFQISKEDYINNAKDNTYTSFAIVKDGQWFEKGEMGWFGIVTNEKERMESFCERIIKKY